jgi:hypothetical protein
MKSSFPEILNKTLRYFGFYKVLFIFAIGCLILFTDFFYFINTPLKKYGLGILFIAYSIYRGYTVFKKIKNPDL